jgi:hypothetical protein
LSANYCIGGLPFSPIFLDIQEVYARIWHGDCSRRRRR